MSPMLLSINPIHVQNIFSGLKKYEFRKVRCKEGVKRLIFYSTAPEKKIVGEAEIEEILEDDVLVIWNQTKYEAGISYKFYREYFKGKKTAVAYKLMNVEMYDQPKTLDEIGVSSAPQSFMYLRDCVL